MLRGFPVYLECGVLLQIDQDKVSRVASGTRNTRPWPPSLLSGWILTIKSEVGIGPAIEGPEAQKSGTCPSHRAVRAQSQDGAVLEDT